MHRASMCNWFLGQKQIEHVATIHKLSCWLKKKKKERRKKVIEFINGPKLVSISIDENEIKPIIVTRRKKKNRNFFSRRYSTRGRLFSDSWEKLPVHFIRGLEIFLWTVTHHDKLLFTITSPSLLLLVINKSFSTHSLISNVIIC